LETDTGLEFRASVVVVFELGADGQCERIVQANLVLNKCAQQILIESGRKKTERRRVLHHVMRETISNPQIIL